jgi:hypothetical protein
MAAAVEPGVGTPAALAMLAPINPKPLVSRETKGYGGAKRQGCRGHQFVNAQDSVGGRGSTKWRLAPPFGPQPNRLSWICAKPETDLLISGTIPIY